MILPFIIHIPLILFLAYIIRKRYSSEPLINFYWPGLILKLIAGVSVGLIYTYYYNTYYGDTLLIHICSTELTAILFKTPFQYFKILFHNEFNKETINAIFYHDQPRVLFYCKLISILNIFTFKNYYINGFYLSLFCFYGLWFLGNTIIKNFKAPKDAVAFAFLFFPSFVFWTSGVLKESFVMGCIAFIIFISLKYIHLDKKINYKDILILLLLFFCTWKIKFYYLLVLTPCMLSYCFIIIVKNRFQKIQYNNIKWFLLFIVSFILLSVFAITIHPSFNLSYLINSIYENYTATLKASGKIDFEFPGLEPDLFNILINLPKALFIGLFRPFIWESAKNITLLVALENLAVLLLFITQILSFFLKRQQTKLIVFATIFYVSTMAAFMALIAPNWGTLSRYKVCYLPFLILMLTINNPLFHFIVQQVSNKIKIKIFHFKNH